MKILVTGASGFTGSHLCERLLREGYKVKALVRAESAEKKIVTNLANKGLEIVLGDLRNYSDVERAMKDVEIVYHIAALFRQEGLSRKVFWDTNVLATMHLVNLSISSGVKKFVHCSTVGVHGEIKNPPACENSPFAPGDHYQKTKLEGERVVWEKINEGKLLGVIFRPAGIYGPGDMRFFKLFKAIAQKRFVMIGKCNVYYHFTYIDDLIDGILLCGTRQEALGNIFIIAGSTYITLKDLFLTIAETLNVSIPRLYIPVLPVYWAGWLCEKIFKPLGLEPPIYRRRVDFFKKNRAFDISKAKHLLGYNPKIDIKEGIKRTADWYIANNLLL